MERNKRFRKRKRLIYIIPIFKIKYKKIMNTKVKVSTVLLLMLLAFSVTAQLGNLRDAGKRILDQKSGTTSEKITENAETTATGDLKEIANQKKISLDDEKFNIIFSSFPIDPDNKGESMKKFSADDNVYALALLPKAVKQYFSNVKSDSKLDVEIFLYSVKISPYEWIKEPVTEQLSYSGMKISGSLIENSYLIIDILPAPESTNAYGFDEVSYKKFGQKFDGPALFAEELSKKLEPGDNVIEVLIKLNYEDVAKGRFLVTGSDFGIYSNLADKLNETGAGAGMKNARLPKAERNDATMEKQMIAAVKSSNAWTNKRLDATDIIKVNIYDADWHIRRHQISGAILHRYIRAAMAVKTQSGECAYYIITFQEDYVGGKFQPMKYDGAGDKVMMDCTNVN
jgi:hypothetical protein